MEIALAGKNGVMPVLVRTSDEPYAWEVGEASLSEVANVEKKVPSEYIAEDGFGITEACRRYLAPLIQGEAYPPYRNGLPDYVRAPERPGREEARNDVRTEVTSYRPKTASRPASSKPIFAREIRPTRSSSSARSRAMT